ncbi:unnamed protein product [Phytomonas sp. Hart1]|nr:unnamed protein product [Phytomonas sp. Hart1]|eukprot:CCW71024.1 unnamed protein product [Phytomonas sp. isolate Hart1]
MTTNTEEKKLLKRTSSLPPLPGKSPLSVLHPFSCRVAGLLSPMSLIDQKWTFSFSYYAIFSTLMVSFPIAYVFEDVVLCVYSILAAACVSAVVCLPNWRQNIDSDLTWVSNKKVIEYYDKLAAAKNTTKKITKGKGKNVKVE